MPTLRWTGAGTATAQVDNFTPANVEINDVFTLTVTGLDGTSNVISFTATAATVANVTAGLTTAWNASTHALCTPITASDQTTYMDLTADTAGEGFTVASTTTDGGGTDTQTLTRAVSVANAGPKDWSDADNWDGGAVPGGAASQDVYVENFTGDIIYGLDQSGIANTLTTLNVAKSFTGGLGYNGATGESGTYLQIKATAVDIGGHYSSGNPSGSGRIMINTGATQSAIVVHSTRTPSDTSKPSCRLLCNQALTTISVTKGSVGIAIEAGETATLGSLFVDYDTRINTDAEVYIGVGATITTITKTGGNCVHLGDAVSIFNSGGVTKIYGDNTITSLGVSGGSVECNTTGTIITVSISDGGVLDFTKSSSSRTVTNVNLNDGGKLKYDSDVVTFTNEVGTIETVPIQLSVSRV